MEFVCAVSGISWAFLSLPLILCHVHFRKVEALDFSLFFFFRTSSWNLEPCLGLQLKYNEVGGTISGLELLDRKFNKS